MTIRKSPFGCRGWNNPGLLRILLHLTRLLVAIMLFFSSRVPPPRTRGGAEVGGPPEIYIRHNIIRTQGRGCLTTMFPTYCSEYTPLGVRTSESKDAVMNLRLCHSLRIHSSRLECLTLFWSPWPPEFRATIKFLLVCSEPIFLQG